MKAQTAGKQKLKTQVAESRNSDDFIMFPTVDFCFKELMQNEKVRKGIISAILSVDPKDVDSSKQRKRSIASTLKKLRTAVIGGSWLLLFSNPFWKFFRPW